MQEENNTKNSSIDIERNMRWLWHVISSHGMPVQHSKLAAVWRGTKQDHHNEIISGLILGGIPQKYILGFKKEHHVQEILDKCAENEKPLALVIRVLEEDIEGQGVWPSIESYSVQEWQDRNIKTMQLKSRDGLADFTNESLYEVIQEIKKTIEENKTCYVHCRKGEGRSGAVVLAFLCTAYSNPETLRPMQFHEAIATLTAKREQVCLSVVQKEKILEFIEYFGLRQQEQISTSRCVMKGK